MTPEATEKLKRLEAAGLRVPKLEFDDEPDVLGADCKTSSGTSVYHIQKMPKGVFALRVRGINSYDWDVTRHKKYALAIAAANAHHAEQFLAGLEIVDGGG